MNGEPLPSTKSTAASEACLARSRPSMGKPWPRGDAKAEAEMVHADRLATIGYLAASIVHEVKQPIAAIVMNADAALRWLDHPTANVDAVRQALSRIVSAGERADDLVDRTRDMAKKTPRRRDPMEINATIREAIEFVSAEAANNGVSVKTEFVETLAPVSGDRAELQQVLLNLIINAIEAMNGIWDGPREVLITTEQIEAGCVLVSVCDSGPGLTPGVQEDFFKPFHTTKPNGLGLGLSICRSIIEGHGGSLWASANAPRGAVFRFTLLSNSPIASPP
jgi:C4-dicarboxylate-specific signal transduction histidine kinase